MSPPSLLQRFRQTIGRAFRETGQALDRVALRMAQLTVTQKYYGEDEPVLYQDFLSRHRQQFPLLNSGRPVVSPQVAYVAPCATLIGSVTVHEGASIWYGAVLRADSCAHAESFKKSDKELLDESAASVESLLATKAIAAASSQVEASTEKDEASTIDGPFALPEKKPGQAEADSFYTGGGIVIGKDTNIQDGSIITARTGHTQIGQGVTVGHLAQIHSATIGDFALIGMGSILQEGCRVESEAFIAAGTVVGKDQVVPAGELWAGNPARKLRSLTQQERERLHDQSSEYVQVAITHAPSMELGGNLCEKMIEEAALLQIPTSTSPPNAEHEQQTLATPTEKQPEPKREEQEGAPDDRQKVAS